MHSNTIRRGATTAASLVALASIGFSASAQKVEGAGATFPAPIYKVWFAKYQQATKTSVDYQAIGSGGGIAALKARTVDFGASDAPLSAADNVPGTVVHIPTVGGAVVLSYNIPGVGAGLRFTPEIIAGIYLGQIKSWDDPKIKAVNPGANLPALGVKPVFRTDGSGTTYIFTTYLKSANAEWAASIGAGKSVSWPTGTGGKGNPGVANLVNRTVGGIGYVELAYALQDKLAYGSVKNKAGNFVTPSEASTTAAIAKFIGKLKQDIKTPVVNAPGVNSYPISGLTYVLLYKDGGRNTPGATKLWSWAMEEAQQAEAEGLHYAALPKELVALNLAALKSIRGSQAK